MSWSMTAAGTRTEVLSQLALFGSKQPTDREALALRDLIVSQIGGTATVDVEGYELGYVVEGNGHTDGRTGALSLSLTVRTLYLPTPPVQPASGEPFAEVH